MPNMRDVAQKAGVAPITVSRVINDSGYVSDEVRLRVMQAIEELNYVPNRLGPSMRSKRSNTIGLIVTDITNPFWTTIVRGVEDAAYKAGYHLFLCNSDESAEKELEYVELLLSRQVDGFLIAPAETSFASLDVIDAQEKPIVLLDRTIDNQDNIDIVRGDSERGAYVLTKHLLDLNHESIVLLNGPASVSTAVDRASGYRRAMAEAGLSNYVDILWGEFTQDSGYLLAVEALQKEIRPTAIIAANNFIAIGAIRVLDSFGYAIPDDVSLAVFDDIPEAIAVRPFLTAVAQPAYKMGQLAANTLFERFKHPNNTEVKSITLPFELKIRASTKLYVKTK